MPQANFPFRKAVSDMDVDVPRGAGDAAYLAELREALPQILSAHRPDLVLYDAGVDVFSNDQLGYLQLSHAGIYQRDLYVLDACVAAGIPVAAVIGGGYDRDALALARRHGLVHRAACDAADRTRARPPFERPTHEAVLCALVVLAGEARRARAWGRLQAGSR